MKLQHWITILALLAMSGFALGCEEEAEETETPAAETPPEETGEAEEAIEEAAEEPAEMAEEAEAAEGAAGGSVCEQAQSCCEAYVQAVGANTPGVTVESACAGVQNAQGPTADSVCQAAIDGWRQSLDALPNVETPSACQGG